LMGIFNLYLRLADTETDLPAASIRVTLNIETFELRCTVGLLMIVRVFASPICRKEENEKKRC
jgi:hypothetical protein